MADVAFFAGEGFNINNLSGSGLGFYGDAGFGASVQVGLYQGRTFITDSTGTSQGPEVDNIKYLNQGSGIIGQTGSGVAVLNIPNYLATLNIRFTNDVPVQTQAVELRIFDRVNINNPASGVTTKVAELIHPSTLQTEAGSGDSEWNPVGGGSVGGSGEVVSLISSPGTSGLRPNGAATTDTVHDWYIALSATPDSIGSKTQYAASIQLEFL